MSEDAGADDVRHDRAGDSVVANAEPASKPPSTPAQRALAEAAERRRKADEPLPKEVNGRGGLEPVRYGDWEVKGIASDF